MNCKTYLSSSLVPPTRQDTIMKICVFLTNISNQSKIMTITKDESFQPPHDKTNKMTVCTAETLISLGIRPESSLCAQWVAKDLSFLQADSEDSDQTGRVPRLI